MVILFTFILAASVGCVLWVFLRKRDASLQISGRLAGASAGSPQGPGAVPIDTFFKKQTNKKFSIESIQSDKMAKNLFLAGMQNETAFLWLSRVRRGLLALPVLLVLLYAIAGCLTAPRAFVALLIGVVSLIAMQISLKVASDRRQKRILRCLPQVLDLLVVGAEAGMSFLAALERILPELDPKEPLVQELLRMHHEVMSGLSLAEACKRLSRRCEVSDLSLFLGSIVQTDQIGSSLAGTLRSQATEIRERYRQRLRMRAMKIPVKILFPLVFIFMAFILLNLSIVFFQVVQVVSGSGSFGNAAPASNTQTR